MTAVFAAAVVLSLLSVAGCTLPVASGHTTTAVSPGTTTAQPEGSGPSSAAGTPSSLVTSGPSPSTSEATSAIVPTTGSSVPASSTVPPGVPSTSAPVATSSSPTTRPTETAAAHVTVSVVCHTAVAQVRAGEIPPDGLELPLDGIILAPVRIPLQSGDTALPVLVRAVTAANPDFGKDNVLVKGGNYIEGIGNDAMPILLYEKDFGPESGWLYYIDGAYVSVGASTRVLQSGENIVWQYTCASGRDLE